MVLLRSLAFNVAFYVVMILWMLALAPAFAMPRRVLMAGVAAWSRAAIWMLRVIAGVKVEVRGIEHLPPGGALVASKHQSTFETLSLFHLFHDPSFILKRELMYIPYFGWLAAKAAMIPVDRKGGREALKVMTIKALQELREGRQILIYPEGTRRPPGADPVYKFGIAYLYRATKMPVVPVALNSGLFWPRRGFLRHPGTIVVEFLPQIEPGLTLHAFMARLQGDIEAASDRLLAEAARAPTPPPIPEAARRRIEAATDAT